MGWILGLGNGVVFRQGGGGLGSSYWAQLLRDYSTLYDKYTISLDNFQNSFNISQVAGSVEYNTDDYYSGNRSLKITTDAILHYGTAKIDLGAKAVGLGEKYLMLMIKKSPDTAKISNITLHLYGENNVDLGTFVRSYGGNTAHSDDWEIVTFGGNSLTVQTARVRYINISITTSSLTDPGIVFFNELRMIDKPTNGYVTITMDGAYTEQYTMIKPLLDTRGYKGQIFISQNDYIGGVNYMTLNQLKECEALGWDITSHSGVRVDEATEEELETIAITKRNWLWNNGFIKRKGDRWICALQGIWNILAVNVLKNFFLFLRDGNAFVMDTAYQNGSLPIFNRGGIQGITEEYTKIVTHLGIVAAHKQWATIGMHVPSEAGGVMSLAEIEAIFDLIGTLGLTVVTWSDVADILKLGKSENMPVAPTDLQVALITDGIRISWTDNSAGANETEIWLKSDSGEYSLHAIAQKTEMQKDLIIAPVDMKYVKIRTRTKAGYSDFSNEVSIAMLGSEIIDQVHWADAGLTWWNYKDVAWTSDGVKINCNGIGALRKYSVLEVDAKYKVKVSYKIISGRFAGWANTLLIPHKTAGTFNDSLEYFIYGTNAHIYIQSYDDCVAEITALSVKKVLVA